MNDIDIYTDGAAFETLQRVSNAYAKSELVPGHMRNNPANVITSLILAREMGVPPMMVLQSVYFVHGRPGFSAQFMLARANASQIWRGPIRWEEEGSGDTLRTRAYATPREGDDEPVYGTWITWDLAKAEGWTKNSKYKTMPETMFRYRAATMFIRQYCPEVMLGYYTAEEMEDVAVAAGRVEVMPPPADPASEVVEAEHDDDIPPPSDTPWEAIDEEE